MSHYYYPLPITHYPITDHPSVIIIQESNITITPTKNTQPTENTQKKPVNNTENRKPKPAPRIDINQTINSLYFQNDYQKVVDRFVKHFQRNPTDSANTETLSYLSKSIYELVSQNFHFSLSH